MGGRGGGSGLAGGGYAPALKRGGWSGEQIQSLSALDGDGVTITSVRGGDAAKIEKDGRVIASIIPDYSGYVSVVGGAFGNRNGEKMYKSVDNAVRAVKKFMGGD